jgi:hypothetical protein
LIWVIHTVAQVSLSELSLGRDIKPKASLRDRLHLLGLGWFQLQMLLVTMLWTCPHDLTLKKKRCTAIPSASSRKASYLAFQAVCQRIQPAISVQLSFLPREEHPCFHTFAYHSLLSQPESPMSPPCHLLN